MRPTVDNAIITSKKANRGLSNAKFCALWWVLSATSVSKGRAENVGGGREQGHSIQDWMSIPRVPMELPRINK